MMQEAQTEGPPALYVQMAGVPVYLWFGGRWRRVIVAFPSLLPPPPLPSRLPLGFPSAISRPFGRAKT